MSDTEIKEHDGLTRTAVTKVAEDAYKSARDRIRAKGLTPFDEDRVYCELERLVLAPDKFPMFPKDAGEACCTRWLDTSGQMRSFEPDFRYCPYCGVRFKIDRDDE